jgi:hypothetical protein
METNAASQPEPLDRLLTGKPLELVARELELPPDQLITALGEAGLIGDAPALVQHAPLHPRLRDSLTDQALAPLFPNASKPDLLGLSAGLLLIHDFWDASHDAAQRADDLGERFASAYWHGIAHRREPDPGNAAYWFRRVGKHSIFPDLATLAKARMAESPGVESAGRLIAGGVWNPLAMIDLCTDAKPGSPAESLALALQREEMRLLLKASLDRVSRPRA